MIRLIGILTGSALAVTALLVAFGVPELTGSVNAPVAAPLAEAALPDVEPTVIEAMAVEAPPQAVPVQQAEPIDQTDGAGIAPATDIAMTSEFEPVVDKVEEPAVTPPPVPAPTLEPQNWYAFWSPFRSEIAADGFIAELQRTTGLDYRVVKLKPGVYEVAFAYTDPVDRQDKLEQISAATGLEMSGG